MAAALGLLPTVEKLNVRAGIGSLREHGIAREATESRSAAPLDPIINIET